MTNNRPNKMPPGMHMLSPEEVQDLRHQRERNLCGLISENLPSHWSLAKKEEYQQALKYFADKYAKAGAYLTPADIRQHARLTPEEIRILAQEQEPLIP